VQRRVPCGSDTRNAFSTVSELACRSVGTGLWRNLENVEAFLIDKNALAGKYCSPALAFVGGGNLKGGFSFHLDHTIWSQDSCRTTVLVTDQLTSTREMPLPTPILAWALEQGTHWWSPQVAHLAEYFQRLYLDEQGLVGTNGGHARCSRIYAPRLLQGDEVLGVTRRDRVGACLSPMLSICQF